MKTLKALLLTLTFAPVALTIAQTTTNTATDTTGTAGATGADRADRARTDRGAAGTTTGMSGLTGMAGMGTGTPDTTTNASQTGMNARTFGQNQAATARTGQMGTGAANTADSTYDRMRAANRARTGDVGTTSSAFDRMRAGNRAHEGAQARGTTGTGTTGATGTGTGMQNA